MVKDLNVDDAKCTGCGICAETCGPQKISKRLGKSPTAYNPNEECILCGHCVAICPTAAISVGNITPDACQVFKKKEMPTSHQTDLLLRSRRSIRNYLAKPVPRKTIQEIIEVARYAPSGINGQPVHWLVVSEKNAMKKYAELTVDWLRHIEQDPEWIKRLPTLHTYVSEWEHGRDSITYEAPSIVLAYAEPRWEEECKIALTFLDLAAHSRKLGACWMGLMNLAVNLWEPFKAELALPEGTKSFGIMTLGYPKYPYHRIPTRREAQITWR
jgi:nitroreductase/NAD-dependent dihydropyrimidine dehydrogenase PreA subunit